MTPNEYQRKAVALAVYPDRGDNLVYPALGLNGEAGEVAEVIKKVIRDDKGGLTAEKRSKLKYELGDVLWYVTVLADEAGFTLQEIMDGNLQKLYNRAERGKLHGSGDFR